MLWWNFKWISFKKKKKNQC